MSRDGPDPLYSSLFFEIFNILKGDKMHIYKAIIATNHTDLNGNRFTSDVFKNIVDKNLKVPVTINFKSENPIGHAYDFEMTVAGELKCHMNVNVPNLNELKLFAVPGGFSNVHDLEKSDENRVTIIRKYTLTEVSLTNIPADPHITNIEYSE